MEKQVTDLGRKCTPLELDVRSQDSITAAVAAVRRQWRKLTSK